MARRLAMASSRTVRAFSRGSPRIAEMRRRLADGAEVDYLHGAPVRSCPSCGENGLPDGFRYCGRCGELLGTGTGK